MGNCFSSAPSEIIENSDGDGEQYNKRFLEDQILGEGEFGVVKLVHDMSAKMKGDENAAPLACKVLRKGMVFKDNVLFSPLKPEILRGEIEMLRTLAGDCYCLKLEAIYESTKCLYVVTEYCSGGELFSYVAQLESDLRTEDVSRISYQLLSAINHCSKHNILHRDIKPENIMFTDPAPGASLRLIDFGSGTIDSTPAADDIVMLNGLQVHKTFAGSAFYISPEMFQHSYTALTDVWSVGATLYVLVAGYPSDALQKAFNILQAGDSDRQLRSLPGLPGDMPDSYYGLLEAALTYRHKKRPTAADLLQYEFVTFHKELANTGTGLSLEAIAAEAQDASSPQDGSTRKTSSIRVTGSVVRHNLFLGFQKFERAVTTLLAAMLPKSELEQLLTILEQKASSLNDGGDKNNDGTKEQKLSVLRVSELKSILRDDLENEQVLVTMSKIPNADQYDSFAYHTALLNEFGRGFTGNAANLTASLGKGRGSFSVRKGNFLAAAGQMTSSNNSQRSTSSLRSFRGKNSSRRGRNSVY